MNDGRHIIWSNDLDYDDWKDDLEEQYPELSENERMELMYEINGDYLDDERINLNIQLSRPILVVGDLGLWNGRRMGYKEIGSGNIRDCLYQTISTMRVSGAIFALRKAAPIPITAMSD